MTKPNNPSAFPIAFDGRFGAYEAAPGMSLRDWFAGQALVGLLANSGNNPVVAGLARERDVTVDEFIAQMAFNAADAMLSEREKSLSHSEGEEK